MADKQAFKTVFVVGNVGSGVGDYATTGKHIAFYECGGNFCAIVSGGFCTDDHWEHTSLEYKDGKLTGHYPGGDRDVVFDYDETNKSLICRMPTQGSGKLAAAMAKTGNGADDEWSGQPD